MSTEFIPPIQSAYINLTTALIDVETAQGKMEDDDFKDALVWVNNALAQLQSAQAKLESEIANPTVAP